ncbi:MAG: alanine--glyoxylate aminotransferase family protein [Flammeovirgaceae bacterium]|nr:MAG: alanine--glyoxylate aminotransferase family protein [Flammeovirgaceae bacterium]
MVSFYPGPSRVYPKVKRYLQDAYRNNIVSINHRSDEFVEISKSTIRLLHEKLAVPADYTIYFVSSATECWEIIAQSLIKEQSIHLFNGAFGKKWHAYTNRIKPGAIARPFHLQDRLKPSVYNKADVICLTQNETSNGTQVNRKIISQIRKKNPHALLAVDATSSMAGIQLDIETADVWFASVQKCFGLPAGLGLMICSPKALERAEEVNNRLHYNSLLYLHEMMQHYQTSYTPNVLGIYLLMRVLESVRPINKVSSTIKSRYKKWEAFFDTKSDQLNFLAHNKTVRSHTVLAIEAPAAKVQQVKAAATNAGFQLGNGYGEWKNTTFRIANFPAIQRKEIARLMDFLYGHI